MRTDGEIAEALAAVLGRQVELVSRRRHAYGTSFPIDALEVRIDGGPPERLLLKDLGTPAAAARSVKPGFLHDPLREIAVYLEVLAKHDLGTPHCYGASIDPDLNRYWLFLEHVPGVELWQVGELPVWEEVAGWLARFHARGEAILHPRAIRCDRAFFEGWLHRARAATRDERLDRLAAAYSTVVDQLLALPVTLIHGEFYPSNVLIGRASAGVRVCAVDWEMTARGPGLLDLAAITAGGWTEAERAAIQAAYNRALPTALDAAALRRSLACCRLHLALQWLGWAEDWTPPREHAQDWMEVALSAAGELGIN